MSVDQAATADTTLAAPSSRREERRLMGPLAVGLALLISAHARSFDHAAALGGGANIVLAALAGIMVPRPLMPAAMQTVSEWSPMGWALDSMQTVFLGAPDASQVLPKVSLLLSFACVCLLLSWYPIRRLDRSV